MKGISLCVNYGFLGSATIFFHEFVSQNGLILLRNFTQIFQNQGDLQWYGNEIHSVPFKPVD